MDLDRLINEVLQMVKDRGGADTEYIGNEDNRKSRTLQRQRDALKEVEDRKQAYALETQRVGGTQALALEGLKNTGESGIWDKRIVGETGIQTLKNTGDLAVQGSKNTGELARQGLANVGLSDVAKINLTGEQYKSDSTLNAEKYKTDDPERVIAEMVKSGMYTPEQTLEFGRKYRAQRSTVAPTPADISGFNRMNPVPSHTAGVSPASTPAIIPRTPSPSLLSPSVGHTPTSLSSPRVNPWEEAYKKRILKEYEDSTRFNGPRPGSRSVF